MSHEILPEHIRASLSQYSKHQQCTCLHCGYSGLMGVHREEDKISKNKGWVIFSVSVGLFIFYDVYLEMKGLPLLPWWLPIIVVIILSVFQASQKQIYLACPNCNSELKVN
jgi:hypothetical protein